MNLSEKLQALTEFHNKAKLARAADLAPGSLTSIILGNAVPSSDTIVNIARALGVDIGWLLSDETGWPPVRVEKLTPGEFAKQNAAKKKRVA